MKNKKLQAILFGLFVLSAAAFAEKGYAKPGNSDVVLVTRVSTSPLANDSYYAQYYSLKNSSIIIEKSKDTKSYIELEYANAKNKSHTISLGAADDFLSGKIALPKNRTITLSDFQYHFGGNPFMFFFYLPLGTDLVVPEGAKYVYIGSFVYKTAGNQFEITGVDLNDEYDAALKIVKERYGDDAELVRVPLREQQKKADK